jgi:hypothetical protein
VKSLLAFFFLGVESWFVETPRRSEEVVTRLLRALTDTVVSYHPTVRRTGGTMDGLIAGTSSFPGGTGLWRGQANGGALPELFPQNPVMFIAHNFDSDRGFALSYARRGEAEGEFWKRLLVLIDAAELSPDECFFTNALMGLKPGKAEGEMPSVSGYKDQCYRFLRLQVEIVQPRALIVLGVKAEKYVHGLGCPTLISTHPKDWRFRELATQRERLLAEGKRIGAFIADRQQQPLTELLSLPDRWRNSEIQSDIEISSQRSGSVTSQQRENKEATDAWGFRHGSRNSFLMNAIEASGKSKEAIKLEFHHAYPDSAGKSTFSVFFTDVIRPFGSSSVSRGIRIEVDSQGHLSLDPTRAVVVKAAIAKGLLKELNGVERNVYPKKDSAAIEAILFRYRVSLK